MKHRLKKGEKKRIRILAKEEFSSNYLSVEKGEVYDFKVGKLDLWIDLFVPSNANGFWNFLLANNKKRVPNVKCFKLCGTIGENEEHHFAIGTSSQYEIPMSGELFFFPNDSINLKRYGNNKGRITLKIHRLQ